MEAYETFPEGFEIVNHGEGFIDIALYTEEDKPPKENPPFELVRKEKVTFKDWKEYYKPIEVGDAVIIPPWEDTSKFEGKTVLVINPGKAFGTGLHESTQLCLKLLSETDLKGKTALDVGCGSGILTIYALKKGAKFVKAIDVDRFAVEETEENAKANGVADRLEVCHCGPEKVEGTFDVVIANLEIHIFREVLKDIAPKVGDKAVFSGIYTKKELEEFLNLMGEFSLKPVRIEEKNDWFGILAQR